MTNSFVYLVTDSARLYPRKVMVGKTLVGNGQYAYETTFDA